MVVQEETVAGAAVVWLKVEVAHIAVLVDRARK
jgi:hypothetical protein